MDISINKEVQKKAKKIIADKEAVLHERIDKNEYMTDCHSAGICPICGAIVTTYREKRRDGFLIRTNYMVQDCSEHGRVNETTW